MISLHFGGFDLILSHYRCEFFHRCEWFYSKKSTFSFIGSEGFTLRV